MCKNCPVSDPAELVIRLEVAIRFRREMSDAELARSYFRDWDEWPVGKRFFYLQDIRRARQAAELAEMERDFGYPV